MGIFSSFSKLIDAIDWRSDDPDALVWHCPRNNLTTYTQLTVNESQEAILFKDGEMFAKFGPGRHTLDTRNIPVLHKLYGFPFGGKNPFTAEVWFVNRLDVKSVNFKTAMFRYHDPDYRTMVPLIAHGRYGLKIADSSKFIKKVVGTQESFSSKQLTDYVQGELSTDVVSRVSGHMQADTIGIKAISGYLSRLSTVLREEISPVYANYGLDLVSFHITSVDVDESRSEGREIVKAMTEQSAQSIAGYTWQQKQAFGLADEQVKVAGEAIRNTKSNFGVLGAMMMASGGGNFFGGGAAQTVAGAMSPVASSASYDQRASGSMASADMTRVVMCSKCSRKYPTTSKFCPHCGNPYTPCPKCGYDNDERAVRCTNCGAQLVDSSGGTCEQCGFPLPAGVAFCPNCGKQMQKVCSRCKTPLKSGVTFCPVCGMRVLS